jgi:hypothetical protein
MYVEAPSGHAARKIRSNADFGLVVRLQPPPVNLLGLPSWRLLIELAARRWGTDAVLILSDSRDQLVTAARHHAMWLLREHTRYSLPQIGRLFGRDHSTVISGIAHHLERVAGTRRIPFVWTRDAVRQLKVNLRAHTLPEACRRLGITPADYLRCPGRMGVVREALRQWSYRRVAARAGMFGR